VGKLDKQSEHLTDAQIEQYGLRTTGPAGTSQDQHLEAHLAECESCGGRVLAASRPALTKVSDKPVTNAARPDCPSEDQLRDLAAGLCRPEQAPAILQHVAQCDRCGPILRMFTEDFDEDLTTLPAEDQDILGKLKSSSPSWQTNLVREVQSRSAARAQAAGQQTSNAESLVESLKKGATGSGSSAGATGSGSKSPDSQPGIVPRPSRFRLRWLLVPATAAACAAIAFSVWYNQRETPEKVEKLLAQAYTEQRTMEMRWPGAAHADFKQTRSGETASLLNSPEALRKAASAIADRLKKNPDDPKWLLLSARLDLLDWHYKSAMATLNKTEGQKNSDPRSVRMTHALALYEQAESEPERQAQSYGRIIDLMGKTLQSEPNDSVALFNRAVACEKTYAYECAIADYESLLNASKNSDWLAEARDHLTRIKEKKNLAR